jgi:hypothetical protein
MYLTHIRKILIHFGRHSASDFGVNWVFRLTKKIQKKSYDVAVYRSFIELFRGWGDVRVASAVRNKPRYLSECLKRWLIIPMHGRMSINTINALKAKRAETVEA